MPMTLVCQSCQTRYSSQTPRNQCPCCGRQFEGLKPGPVIYWRVVGVALATAVLFVITTMFALKAWADGRRSTMMEQSKGNVKSVLPVTKELPVTPMLKLKEKSQQPDSLMRPEIIPAKPPAKRAKEEMVAKVENPAPSGFN